MPAGIPSQFVSLRTQEVDLSLPLLRFSPFSRADARSERRSNANPNDNRVPGREIRFKQAEGRQSARFTLFRSSRNGHLLFSGLLFTHAHHLPLPLSWMTNRLQLFHGVVVTSATLSSPPSNPVASGLLSSDILSIQDSLLSRWRTASEIAGECLDHLHKVEPQIRSFLHVSDFALKEAEEVDQLVSAGRELPSLAGVLVGVKDNICIVDMPSTGGSKFLKGYRAAFDAIAVRNLREAGAIVVGKTNLDEFGMGSSTEGFGFHITVNPWDLSQILGGSSVGSTAVVSSRQCAVSLGSDTGGSVR